MKKYMFGALRNENENDPNLEGEQENQDQQPGAPAAGEPAPDQYH